MRIIYATTTKVFFLFPCIQPTSGVPISISLMDVYENGFLDFMVTYELHTKSKTLNGIQVLRNEYNVDAAFLKVAGMDVLLLIVLYE